MSKAWLDETEHEIQTIKEEMSSLKERLKQLDDRIVHWEIVHQDYVARHGLSLQLPIQLETPQDGFQGLSTQEIILQIAKRNGEFPGKVITEILRGKVANPVHADSVAYATLGRMVKQGKLIKVRRGYYRQANGIAK